MRVGGLLFDKLEWGREVNGVPRGRREVVHERESVSGSSSKGAGWMPRHRTAKKDVASCEKPGGAASER